MPGLSINSHTLDKYFGLLSRLDNLSKKKLIKKLTESLELKNNATDLKVLFGTWEDSRDSDEIIREIKASRVDKKEIEGFQ